MLAFVKRLWAAAPVATILLAVALAAALLFGARSAMFFVHGPGRIAREQPVAAWMTPRYVAHSWQVPREVILEAVNAPDPPPRGPMNYYDLAELNHTTPEALIEATEAAIAAWRAEHPEPRDAPPEPPNGAAGADGAADPATDNGGAVKP